MLDLVARIVQACLKMSSKWNLAYGAVKPVEHVSMKTMAIGISSKASSEVEECSRLLRRPAVRPKDANLIRVCAGPDRKAACRGRRTSHTRLTVVHK